MMIQKIIYKARLFVIPLGLVLGAPAKNSLTQPVSQISFSADLPIIPSKEISVLDFGAIGDGAVNDTESIQKAIDFCTENKSEFSSEYFNIRLRCHN